MLRTPLSIAADMMDVVLLDHIAARTGLAIAPRPADRDAAVVRVVDVVAANGVAAALPDPDAGAPDDKVVRRYRRSRSPVCSAAWRITGC
jgi:hypothetical protein